MIELGVIVAVIIGIGQIAKEFIPKKFMPIVSLVLGVVAGVVFLEGAIEEKVFYGIAIGLAASGLFDVAKLPTKKK
ncbi:holin [Terrihalobacillus insolitus]|uniref:holin n=1 Tax=Terrihalobacillus insolitus TaxID=2950438 RepID=UPI0023408802|nr:holin [Terrihalobacillus insolitus]MDC3413950.1 holin [Terrihalobacillus insolitus]